MNTLHPAGRALTFDGSLESFVMIVNENLFLVIPCTKNSDLTWKNCLTDNHYKTIYRHLLLQGMQH